MSARHPFVAAAMQRDLDAIKARRKSAVAQRTHTDADKRDREAYIARRDREIDAHLRLMEAR